MDEQRRVAEFVATHDMEAEPAYRLLDLQCELGELAKEVCESTDYGGRPADVTVSDDELGDALFALLALAGSLDIDAGAALETSLAKYEGRIEETGDAASGR
ncbi:MazG nucleotide pyrophosphohydrolase domain-containing protein [Haloarchaeobius litoreus]|uniref:MazG nucleotide pyrophosphohydrolase domain-containing protein n=1 Tax=Haloarchaeobius litoreus TaxID=755306 RepID=A0ABD6DHK5_9EURY|nr:MazG nucleotide pyrophosphohydrolase domain-containing protein [Haloarchaeobius litoreus]